MRSSLLVASLLALGALVPAACTQNFDLFGPSGGTGGSSTSTSTSGTHATTGTGTGGGGGEGGHKPECTVDTDCDDSNVCTADTCGTDGKCAHDKLDGDQPGLVNTPGDCKVIVCVAGVVTTNNDDTDVLVDGNPCTLKSCSGGVLTVTDADNNAPCGTPPQACDGNGNCVGCHQDSDCPTGNDCQDPTCDPSTKVCGLTAHMKGDACNNNKPGVCDDALDCVECNDGADCSSTQACVNEACVDSCGTGTKDGDETDQDCGGHCNACDDNKHCGDGTDCKSHVCKNTVCQQPACNDTQQNGNETDVDCGGATTCARCADTRKCLADTDCLTNHKCSNNKCYDPCTDNTKDGVETDKDCGGNICSKRCTAGQGCLADSDCDAASGHCGTDNKCHTQCTDGKKDNDETDQDCGGATCPNKCANTKGCAKDTDCTSGFCNTTTNKCAAPTCPDGFQNEGETDLDCGGTNCMTKCADGKKCGANSDCSSGVCTGNKCITASCPDGVQNEGETDLDCGGPNCATKCGDGKKCGANSDCSSGTCTGNKCIAASCTDGVQNEGETDLDCGGPNCAGKCGDGKKCTADADCDAATGHCSATTMVCKSVCFDEKADGDETDTDCGGPTCTARCGVGKKCTASSDCLAGHTCNGSGKCM